MSSRALALAKQPFLAFGRAYNAKAQASPFLVGTVTTVVKTSAADLFAQKVRRGSGLDGGQGCKAARLFAQKAVGGGVAPSGAGAPRVPGCGVREQRLFVRSTVAGV